MMLVSNIMAEVEDLHACICDALDRLQREQPDIVDACGILKAARDCAAELIQQYEESTP